MEYLKKASKTSATGEKDVRETVHTILEAIEGGGEAVARDYARQFDQWSGEIVVTPDQREMAARQIPQKLKDDIHFAHDNVRRFAQAQRDSLTDIEIEVVPGLVAGQKQVPVSSVGCYAPGGRYSHVASAIMTVTTANVAGVKHISACSPPRPEIGMNPAVLYAFDVCGADTILNIGGVQGVAAMAFGLFGCPQARVLAGPGNQFVAEAKRILFGRVGIDMFAGPTESLVIADGDADPKIVAADLVGQAEHGYNSPVWLVTTNRQLAQLVSEHMLAMIADLPELNRESAHAAWRDFGEIILCESREEVAQVCDQIAPEHLQVQAADLDWWLNRLQNYGSLFLGEETTVAFGDKVSGPNHVLPTKGAAHYSGGLFVGKFMKTVTWQRSTRDANRDIAQACARISRLEGMEGHARSADVRLAKYFPQEQFDLTGTK
ncbi:MAG: histidinol dehydrogenase [Burkholderiaceae bacterium]